MAKYDLETVRAKDLPDDELVMQCFSAKWLKGNWEGWVDLARKGLLGCIRMPLPITREEFAELQKECPIPMLACLNAELTAGLKPHGRATGFPMQMALGATGDEELAYACGKAIGTEIRWYGGTWLLGPVLDLAMERWATCVGNRAFGADPEFVARMGAAIIRGFQDTGMYVSAKHYPGKGRATNDTHIVERDIDVPLDVLEREEFYPYKYAVEHADLSGIMTSHLRATVLDKEDLGVVSKPHLDYIFETMGMKGLVITDSIAMGGFVARYSEEDRFVKCLEAGNHSVIGDPFIGPEQTLAHMTGGLKSGRLTREMLEPKVDELLAAKRKIFLESPEPEEPDYDAHEKLARDVALKSITEFRKPDALRGVDTSRKIFVIVISDQQNVEQIPEVQLDTTKQGEVAQAVRERLPEATIREIPAYPPSGNISGCLRMSLRENDRTIVVASATCGAFKGTAHLSRPVVSMLEGLRTRIDTFVLLGNPWAILDIPPVPRVIFGYRGAHTVEAAIAALMGDFEPTGKLPVPATPPGF
jgi:beta-N-acetylhexosaminidase